MRPHVVAVLAALAMHGLTVCQDGKKQFTEAEKQAFAMVDDLMHQCRLSMKAGRLAQAEQQCTAAIQQLKAVGWMPQGETAVLGMIYYKEGAKRLGFETVRDSFPGYHGSAEIELFLGRVAIELREYKTASAVIQRLRLDHGWVESIPNGTYNFWPAGDDAKTWQATFEFLEGERLCQTRETKDEGIKLLRHADKICPGNVAINYALGRELRAGKDPLAPAPFFRVVSEKGKGGIKWDADQWLNKYRNELRSTTGATSH